MPAPRLVRFGAAAADMATTAFFAIPGSSPGAGRALVIGRLSITCVVVGGAIMNLRIGSDATGYSNVARLMLAENEVYTESGLVVLAGETVSLSSSVASGLNIAGFGQEVDN